ncbi:hypothetical protein ACWGJ2_13910 [Streptomyces sp. NPDC054796]
MRSTSSLRPGGLRRAVVALAVVPVLALSSAGCGGGGGDEAGGGDGGGRQLTGGGDGDGGGNGGNGEGAKSGGKGGEDGDGGDGVRALDAAGLRAALLKSGDVKGYHAEPNAKDALPPENTMEPDRPACTPITDAVDSKPTYAREAYASGTVMKGDLGSGGAVQQILLSSYGSGDAAKWLRELRKAVKECRGFKGAVGTGQEASLRIEPGGEVGVGDDAVQFTMKDAKGKDSPTVFTVVRAGANTATFMSVGLAGEPVPVARAVVDKQHEKLVAAARS